MSLLGSMPSSVDRTSKQQTNIPPTFTDDAATLHPGVDNPDNNQEGIQQLARTLSRRSFASASQAGQSAVLGDPLHPEADSPFDPFGEQFDSAAWVKAVFALHTSNPNAPPLRSSGVAFENLLVHGFGSESDYQATVGNMPLKVIGAIKSMVRPSPPVPFAVASSTRADGVPLMPIAQQQAEEDPDPQRTRRSPRQWRDARRSRPPWQVRKSPLRRPYVPPHR